MNFKRLGLLGGKAARGIAERGGLTSARADLMMVLLRYHVSQGELAAMLCVSPAVVSRMVTALEGLGLVWRFIPADRRLREPRLTDAGRKALAQCYEQARGPRDDGALGAQCVGEAIWTKAWHDTLEDLGIDVDTIFYSREPPFGHMQRWNRAYRHRPA